MPTREGAIGVAGVMGGAATEVSGETVDVFLECAFFTPAGVRRTRRALGLSTEASYRFERGIDRWGGVEALRRCIEVVGATAGGELVEAPVGSRSRPGQPSPHLSSSVAGDSGARHRVAVESAGGLSRRHRRDRRLQAGRWPDCGRGAQLASRSGARDRSGRRSCPASRLRKVPQRAPAIPPRFPG